MKRSEINATIKQFEALLDQYRFRIPPYLSFTPEEWADKNHEWDEIRDNMLGWDITDYGEGDFEHKGLALITLRNGNVKDPKYTKVYAEKIMMSMPGQVSPMHFHWNKMEDIIVRGGGTAVFHLYNADPKTEERLDTPVLVCRDGRRYYVPAGEDIELSEGESLTFYPYTYHEYYIKEDSVPTLVGEVSMCNDDNIDNRFYEPVGRFPEIEEDEPAYRRRRLHFPFSFRPWLTMSKTSFKTSFNPGSIMSNTTTPSVVAIGELLWDMLPDGRKPGGAPANFIYHVAQNGVRGTAVTAVGDDELGRDLVSILADNDVNVAAQVNDYPTGITAVRLDDGGIPEYDVVKGVAWDHIEFTDEVRGLVRGADAICYGTIAAREA